MFRSVCVSEKSGNSNSFCIFFWAHPGMAKQEVRDVGGAWWETQVSLETKENGKSGRILNIRHLKTESESRKAAKAGRLSKFGEIMAGRV